MYEIALCDDEMAEMDKVERMLHSYRRQTAENGFMVRKFVGAEELLLEVQQGAYQPDLILMDIYMPGETGIDAAKRLREMGNTSRIAFLTLSKEHALDAFGVDAVSYLVKPFSMEKLFGVLDKVLKDLENEQVQHILVQADDHIEKIAIGDIIYCEAQRKKQCIYLKGGRQHPCPHDDGTALRNGSLPQGVYASGRFLHCKSGAYRASECADAAAG